LCEQERRAFVNFCSVRSQDFFSRREFSHEFSGVIVLYAIAARKPPLSEPPRRPGFDVKQVKRV